MFEVNLSTKTWTTLKNLGNKALFLGHHSSFSIKISNYNTQCNANSIYFTMWMLIPIFNIDNENIIPHFSGKSYHLVPPPMWVEQTFD